MEYIILIIVLAVLLLGGVGSTLFVRGRSSRGLRQGGTATIEAPDREEAPGTAGAAQEQGAGTIAGTASTARAGH
jgi:flagellar basal body-associated protein FliL